MTPIPIFDLKAQYEQLREELQDAFQMVAQSGRYILGQAVKTFEDDFARHMTSRFCVGVNSGTDALVLALKACGIGPEDSVLTVANTAIPTACAIAQVGATIRFVDIHPQSGLMDETQLEKFDDRAIKAVVPVHLYGNPCAMDRITQIAEERNWVVIEDCAQAHDATLNGKKVGTFGHCGCFSFYPTKNLGAMGDAGAIITSDSTIAKTLRRLRNYGLENRFESTEVGQNSRLDELQAAILSKKLSHLPAYTRRRRQIADIYQAELGDVAAVELLEQGEGSAYHLYVIKTAQREALQKHLEQAGIGSQVHYPIPIYQQLAYKHLKPRGGCPATECFCAEVLSLPLFPELSDDQVKQVCQTVRSFFSAQV